MKYQRDALLVILQDKYRVREHAKSKGVKSPELLFVTDEPEKIPFAELPDLYMIKANHGCGWNILCYDSRFYKFGTGKNMVNEDGSFLNKNIPNSDELSEAEVIATCKKWLASKHHKAEWAYQEIAPQIIIEKLLAAEKNQLLFEYKVFTFRGIPKAMFAASLLYRKRGERALFDTNFEEFSLTKHDYPRPNPLPEKLERLSMILDAASKLGEDIDCAKIDLFDTADGIVLGEMTLYSDGGKPLSPTVCPIFNKWLGDQWVLSKADTRQAILLNIRFNLMRPFLTASKAVRYNLRNSTVYQFVKNKLCKKSFPAS